MEKKKDILKKYFLSYVVVFAVLLLVGTPVYAMDTLFNKVVDAGDGFKSEAGKLELQWRDVEIKSIFYKDGYVTADFEIFNNTD